MEPFGVKITKKALWAPKSLFGPKMHFEPKNALLAQKVIFGRKVRFGAKRAPWNSHELTYPQPFSPPGAVGPRKVDFYSKKHFVLKNAFLAQKCISGAKVHFFAKNALLRPHGADAYKTNGILMKMEPFLAQRRFWAQKCILDPKINFGFKMRKMDPKCILGPKVLFSQK